MQCVLPVQVMMRWNYDDVQGLIPDGGEEAMSCADSHLFRQQMTMMTLINLHADVLMMRAELRRLSSLSAVVHYFT
jgi:hypothetical protein